MNLQMMEGLLGASSNIQLSDTPMSVYRQASAEGDKGMKAEAKAEREKAKLEQEAAIEARREERKQAAERTETGRPQGADLVQISEAAKAALKNHRPAETAEPIDGEPVIYTPSGEVATASEEPEPTVSFTA